MPDKQTVEPRDGQYSCASCGMFMSEPCEHWRLSDECERLVGEADDDVQHGPGNVRWAVREAIRQALAQQKAENENDLTFWKSRYQNLINESAKWSAAKSSAEQRLSEVMGVLREHEWGSLSAHCSSDGEFFNTCPACEYREDRHEHAPDCWLVALLKGDGE